MCLLAVCFRVVGDAAVVVGANREEHYARGGTPPQVVPDAVPFVAGLDPVAGGTWLGVNAHGVLVAVTNRPKNELPTQPRSRGLLVRDLLGCRSARAATDRAATELATNLYAGCNLLCADAESACILHGGDWLRVRTLPPGIHVLANRDVNDASDRRVQYALNWLAARDFTTAADCVAALTDLCSRPGDGDPPICLHGPHAGTTSSSIVVLRRPMAHGRYLHAQGPPDQTPYEDYSGLLSFL